MPGNLKTLEGLILSLNETGFRRIDATIDIKGKSYNVVAYTMCFGGKKLYRIDLKPIKESE